MTKELATIDHAARAHSAVGGSSAERPGLLKLRKNPEMAPQEMREWIDYDPVTGVMRWRKSPNKRLKVGSLVGHVSENGYLRFNLRGIQYRVSRAAWALTYGYWPDALVDHQDQDKLNNRLGNLRLSTEQENMRNAGARHKGLKGASYRPDRGVWVASIKVDKKPIYLGTFPTEQLAHAAYRAAAIELFGEFARFE